MTGILVALLVLMTAAFSFVMGMIIGAAAVTASIKEEQSMKEKTK